MDDANVLKKDNSYLIKIFVLIVPLMFILHLIVGVGVENEVLKNFFTFSPKTPAYYQLSTGLGLFLTLNLFFKDLEMNGKVSRMSIFYFVVGAISFTFSNLLYVS